MKKVNMLQILFKANFLFLEVILEIPPRAEAESGRRNEKGDKMDGETKRKKKTIS